jgi:hypothetical protein
MTKKKLITNIIYISSFYVFVLFLWIGAFLFDQKTNWHPYGLMHDILPILFTVPLAYLGFCFQRRYNFHAALRLLWANIIHAVNKALLYSVYKNDPKNELTEVLLALSKCIDEVRGVYLNVNETKTEKGYYPFESLKNIYAIVENLGHSEMTESQMKEAHEKITANWQIIRRTFLAEFDRSAPSVADTIEN